MEYQISCTAQMQYQKKNIKVRTFWKSHKILRNLHLTFVLCSAVKSKMKISQNFVALSEYINFKIKSFAKIHFEFVKNPLKIRFW